METLITLLETCSVCSGYKACSSKPNVYPCGYLLMKREMTEDEAVEG